MKSPTVLVIDDEEMVRLNLVAYLEDEDFEVISAESGEEGLSLVIQKDIDVAVIDMRLPGMDGNEFILKAHQLNPALQFIIHTGSTEYSLPAELLEIGIASQRVLHKPLSDMGVIVGFVKQLGEEPVDEGLIA